MYYGGKEYLPELTCTGFILGLFSEKAEQAIMNMQQLTEMEVLDTCMEDIEGTILNDTKARQVIENVMQKRPVNVLQEMSKADRNAILKQLKQVEGLSIRQISRLTGISFNIVKTA